MRTFAVGSWSTFGHMVISMALLGFGLSGTMLTFIQRRVERDPERWLHVSSTLFMPAMALAHVVAQRIDFNPLLITSDARQLLKIAAYYVAYGAPFIVGAVFIGVSFIALREQIHKLYFWNMVGSGLGGLMMLPAMFVLPPERLFIPLCIACFVAAVAFCWYQEQPGGRLTLDTVRLGGSLLLTTLALGLFVFAGDIRVSDYKGVSYARKFPDSKYVAGDWGPMGVLEVFDSSYLHFAPGLSDRAGVELKRMPAHAYMGLYIDGGGPIGVMGNLGREEEAYLDYLPMAAAYKILDQPKVMLVQLGGGSSVALALYEGASEVQVVEPNPQVIRLLRDNAAVRKFNGDLLHNPRVHLAAGDPRAYAATTEAHFGLVEVSLIDSTGLSQAAGYSVDENYVYTVEGIRDYMRCLTPDGLLSITVWNKLDPPRNVPRLLATVVRALGEEGTGEPRDRLFVSHLYLSTATIIAKKSPFTREEAATLHREHSRLWFDVVYYPGMAETEEDFEGVLGAFRALYRPDEESGHEKADGLGGTEDSEATPDMGRLYRGSAQWLLGNRSRELFNRYVFDVRPATDNRPYFTAYLKPSTLPLFLGQLKAVSDEWGYILLWGTLAQSVLFGLLIVALPMMFRWRALFGGRAGTGGVIAYYSCLGLGYMLVEMVLIQKLVLFLAAPIYAFSIVITSMLVLSGLGSRFAGRLADDPARGVKLAVLVIVPCLVFYAFLLDPVLRVLLPAPLPVKFALAILLMAPAAFCMGFPFPSGLQALSDSRPSLLPWAWGMNGALSVTGAVLTKLLSISFGFAPVLLLAAGIYALAAAVFGANQATEPA